MFGQDLEVVTRLRLGIAGTAFGFVDAGSGEDQKNLVSAERQLTKARSGDGLIQAVSGGRPVAASASAVSRNH